MQCTDTLGGDGILAYTNPSRNFVGPVPFQTANGLKCARQREEARWHIKWLDSHNNNNPSSSSIINVNPKFQPEAQNRADAHTATMKASILNTIAACLLPIATIAAPAEEARGLTKREYVFHGSITAEVSVQAGVLISLFIQLSKSVFTAAHN